MIPRIFHFIWLGSARLPGEFKSYIMGWQTLHPRWHLVFWTDRNLPYLVPPSFDRATDPRQRADVLRYAVLYLYGGVYVDTDFECLKSIDELVISEDVKAFGVAEDPNNISIGILGCTPRHPLFSLALGNLRESFDRETAIGDQSGPGFFTRVVKQSTLQPEFKIFPTELFFPYSGTDAVAGRPFLASKVTDAYAIHHWASIRRR